MAPSHTEHSPPKHVKTTVRSNSTDCAGANGSTDIDDTGFTAPGFDVFDSDTAGFGGAADTRHQPPKRGWEGDR